MQQFGEFFMNCEILLFRAIFSALAAVLSAAPARFAKSQE
jgi:hypothetical protein